ncbi:MAG: hypothetical protein HYV28_13520 [Ignavibacteriales bacterium]|nr:hypothetical protein [Ignavibacteriales bacterium]
MRHTYLVIIAFFISTLHAQTVGDMIRLSEPGFSPNARTLGMGNAFSAISNDASAMFFNPAGLGFIKRLEIASGFDYNRTKNGSTLHNTEINANNSKTAFNQLAFVFPFPTLQGSLVFGISYNRTKDFNEMVKFSGYNGANNSFIQALNGSKYEGDYLIPVYLKLAASIDDSTGIVGKLTQSGTHIVAGELENWSFAGAVEIEKNLFLGLNLAILSGAYKKEIDYYEDDLAGFYKNILANPDDAKSKGFRSFNYKGTLDLELSGYELKFGMIYKMQQFGNVGLVIQLPKSYTVKEQFIVNASAEFSEYYTSIYPEDFSSKVEYTISTPFVLTGAGSLNFMGATFAGELSLSDYTQAEFDSPVDMESSILTDLNKSIKNSQRAVVNYNLGAEYTLPEVNAKVRFGYFTRKSTYDGDPTSFDKQFFTVGLGFMMSPSLLLDIAYMHGWWEEYFDNYNYIDKYLNSNISRVYQNKSIDDLAISFHYRF